MTSDVLKGMRTELTIDDADFPESLKLIRRPPERLFVIGDVGAIKPGLAVIGARKATPYGIGSARRFARIAAEKGIVIISGGARGCDSEAHRAALEAGAPTVVFLGGGCDRIYPAEHFGLFQRIVDAGGAIVSENPWDFVPLPYTFRDRNRLIAGLADAVLIVEAGLPSGTFSTADEALEAGKEVLVVPGSIMSAESRGSNRLLYQGAVPIVDDESFEDALFNSCGSLKRQLEGCLQDEDLHPVISAILAAPQTLDDLYEIAEQSFGYKDARDQLMELLIDAEAAHVIARRPDGKWGPAVRSC